MSDEQLVAINEALTAEVGELQEVFDFQWKANMRAVEMWRAANPGNDLVLPDSARLTVWLLDRNETLTAELATCEKYRDAYSECDRIGTQAVRDLETKLAKVVEGLTDLVKDCEAEYPPSHGAIKHFCLAIIAEIESSEAVTLGEKT
jgi:hypothetical protein